MLKITPQGFLVNGELHPQLVGRSSFKLSNILTYHFTGQGDKYNLQDARDWVEYNQRIFGKHCVLRVFLESAGWDPNSAGMFGSAPADQGFWDDRDALRDGRREREMHPTGKKCLEWFFQTSQETGVVFELTIDATLKHDDIPKGEIDHVIRVTGVQMGEFAKDYPEALIIPGTRNEWNAHNQAGHSLHEVNMWAVRWERDEYWPESQPVVDGGGANDYDFAVNRPGTGTYAMGLIHPERGGEWWRVTDEVVNRLRSKSNGMPVGANESMYYVEPEDFDRAREWYRPSGWTTDWGRYRQFANEMLNKFDYVIFHDEKGVQCDRAWPRAETRLESWARERFGGEPEPPPQMLRYARIINKAYLDIFGRAADEGGLSHYNDMMWNGMSEASLRETLIRSAEYDDKNPQSEPPPPPPLPPEPDPDPDPPDPPPGPRPATQYIPWDTREAWRDKVKFAYSVWRGERDLAFLLSRPQYLIEGSRETVPITSNELRSIIEAMAEVNERGEFLQHRIMTERHRTYEDRSQVRKDVANAMVAELEESSHTYTVIADHFPLVPVCDSIRCKIEQDEKAVAPPATASQGDGDGG